MNKKQVEALDPEERKKLCKLLSEKTSDSGTDKSAIQWMYKGDRPDNEEYLLGRRIDRHVLGNEDEQELHKGAAGALFMDNPNLARRAQMDMQAKMREDPLFQIRRQEEEARKRLLQNPIRMKQLQQLLDEQKTKKKKAKKDKKAKKKKKRSSPSETDSEADDILQKYLAIKKQKEHAAADSGAGRSEDQSPHRPADPDRRPEDRRKYSSDPERDQHSKQRKTHDVSPEQRPRASEGKHNRDSSRSPGERKKSRQSRSRHGDRQRSSSPIERKKRQSSRSPVEETRQRSRSPLDKKGRNNSSSSMERKKKERSRKVNETSQIRDMSPLEKHTKKHSWSPIERRKKERSRSPGEALRQRSPEHRKKGSRSPNAKNKKIRSTTPDNLKSRSLVDSRNSEKSAKTAHQTATTKKKLSAEEMAKRREDMLAAANWRDEQRQKNVAKYRQEQEEEEKKLKEGKDKTSASNFINPLMVEHAGQSTVEDRLKRNKFRIQRTAVDLESSFKK